MTLQELLSYTRRAVADYDMIDEGDIVAVGVSGGKDSMALLGAMKALSGFYPKKFTVRAYCVDMGFDSFDREGLKAYCDSLGVELTVIKTELKKLIFEVRKEKNPCALCSKMRRGALVNACLADNVKKLALGHHMDDVIDTFFMNLMNNGRIGAFPPTSLLDRSGVTVIRPLVYVPEKKIVSYISKNSVPVIKSGCPADKNTDREDIKNLTNDLSKENRDLKSKVFGAIQRAGLDGFHR